jgi:hypothetical protein
MRNAIWDRLPLTRAAGEANVAPIDDDSDLWANRSLLAEIARQDPGLEAAVPGVWIAQKQPFCWTL